MPDVGKANDTGRNLLFGTRARHDLDRVDGRSKNSLAAFIRRTLSVHDGVCNRGQLLQCVLEDPEACKLLKHGRSSQLHS